MSEAMSCAEFEEICGEVVLHTAPGDARAAAFAHAAGCVACRKQLVELTGLVDGLLLLGPSVEPPPDFEGRTLARLGAARAAVEVPRPAVPAARHRTPRRRRVAGLVAAVVVAVVLAGGGLWLAGAGGGSAPAGTLTAAMVDQTGRRVGRVDLGRSPATVFVALPGWTRRWTGFASTGAYHLQIFLADGRSVAVGPVRLTAGQQSWGTVVSFDATEVRRVALETSSGAVLCQASLPAS